ncbi:hypothetical protein ACFQX6_29380 [Streptosporangium lutulentum]
MFWPVRTIVRSSLGVRLSSNHEPARRSRRKWPWRLPRWHREA